MRPILIIAASVAALPILTDPAQAQANRTFVSGHGSDSNPCSVSAPCRTFAQAITQTNPSGEIVVLDSAGYGAVTIDRSITITNPGGVEAGITTAAGATAITINPSTPSFVVTLRGLALEGGNVGLEGIVFAPTVAGTLNIIDCVVKDFTGIGIAITPATNIAGTMTSVLIANSFVLNNASSGIEISPQNGNTTLQYSVNNTTVAGNGTSGGDAGILVNSTFGPHVGDINSSQVYRNNIGVNLIGNGPNLNTYIRNSVMINNLNRDIINNTGGGGSAVYLFNSNEVDYIVNNQSMGSDGTNNILQVVGSGGGLTTFVRM